MGHFWSYSGRVYGALASKFDVHTNIGFIIVNIFFFLEYTGVGKVNGPVGGHVLYIYILELYTHICGAEIEFPGLTPGY